jgi:hypothetical protein
VSRDQILLFGAVALIVVGVGFVRKEYQLSSASASPPSNTEPSAPEAARTPEPVAAAPEPSESQDSSPMLYPSPATEQVPRHRSALDEAVIAHAKDAPVSMLDSSLPHKSAGYWIAHAAGPSAGLRWDVNNCPGARKRRDTRPLCAQANIRFIDGTRFNALVLVGEQPLNPPAPPHYGQPSLLWAAYKKYRGPVVPAPLSLLSQIAAEAD